MVREQKYVQRTFDGIGDRGKLFGQRVLENMAFEQCYFEGQGLSLVKRPEKRTIVRNIEIENCEAIGCIVGPAILDTIHVRNLKTNQVLQVWAAAFRHVTLQGRVPPLMVRPLYSGMVNLQSRTQQAFSAANARFYENVDWAVDVREAQLTSIELHGIPARLIRADPEISAIVTRESVLSTDRWKADDVDLAWRIAIQRMLDYGTNDVLLVAPPGNKRFGLMRTGLRQLLDLKVAEPIAPS